MIGAIVLNASFISVLFYFVMLFIIFTIPFWKANMPGIKFGIWNILVVACVQTAELTHKTHDKHPACINRAAMTLQM